ncbi:MAG: hypothetical protein WAU28_04255, partial [Candidatus Moraniibacteriota bacterium]
EVKPWELVKTDMPAFEKEMNGFLTELAFIASSLRPFLPETSEKIFIALKTRKLEPLFQRILVAGTGKFTVTGGDVDLKRG